MSKIVYLTTNKYKFREVEIVLKNKYGLDVENCEKYVWRNEEDETKI